MDLIRDFCPALGFLASRLVIFLQFGFEIVFGFFLQFGQDTTQRKSKEHFWPALGFWAQNGFQGVAYIGVTTNFFLLVVFLFFLCPLAPNPFCGNLICIVGAESREGGGECWGGGWQFQGILFKI